LAARSDLSRRLRSALVLLAVVALGLNLDAFWLRRDACFAAVVALIVALTYSEFCNLCEARGIRTFRVLGTVGCLGLFVLHWLTLPNVLSRPLPRSVLDAGLVVLIFAVFLRQAFIKDARDALPAVGMTLLGVLYLWFLPSFMLRIRHLGGADWLVTGHNLFVALVFVAKISDVGAYFFGRKFGRTKLIPRISPAKSLEGALFGLASSVGMAFALWGLGALPRITAQEALAFGLLVGVTGQCGDLLESIFKRSGGHKDSAKLLPGYGGLLDVMDSLIISAPPAYLFLRLVGGLRMGTG